MSDTYEDDSAPFQSAEYVGDDEYVSHSEQVGEDVTVEDAPANDCGTRCKESWLGLVLGLVLLLVSGPLLWWNEQRYITTWRVLDESSRLVTEAPCDAALKGNYGSLLHVTCRIHAYEYAPMDSLGVAAQLGTAVLQRQAQMLQWQEDVDERENVVDGHRKTIRNYSYRQVWTGHHIDSSAFKYPDECVRGHTRTPCYNPPFPSDLQGSNPSKYWAGVVDAGVFRLPTELRDVIPADKGFLPPLDVYYGSEGKTYHRTSTGLSSVTPGYSPAVGDTRLSYTVNSAETVSVLGAQAYSPYANTTFSAYTTPKGRFFQPVLMVGEESAAEMFAILLEQNETVAWLLRLAGWLLAWAGLGLCIQPLRSLVSWIPWAGECLGEMVFCALCSAAGVMSLCTCTTIICVAWLFYRPLISVPLLVAAVGVLSFVCWKQCHRNERHGQPDSPRLGPWQPLPAGPFLSPSQSHSRRNVHQQAYSNPPGHQQSFPGYPVYPAGNYPPAPQQQHPGYPPFPAAAGNAPRQQPHGYSGIPMAFPVDGQQQQQYVQPGGHPAGAGAASPYPPPGWEATGQQFMYPPSTASGVSGSGAFSWQQQNQQQQQQQQYQGGSKGGDGSGPPVV